MPQSDQPTSKYEEDLNKKRASLLKKLESGEKMRNLMEVPEWGWYVDVLNDIKKLYMKQISSTQFVNDQNGYVYHLGSLHALEAMLKVHEVTIKNAERAAEQRQELDKEFDRLKDE